MLKLTQPGIVSIIKNSIFIENAYTFAHINDRESFEHFDNTIEYYDDEIDDSQIKFTKKYRYASYFVELQHHIKLYDEYLCWNILRLNHSGSQTRFGFSFSVQNLNSRTVYGSTDCSLINFSTLWRPNYPHQLNIDLPIVEIGDLSLSTSKDGDMQIYKYLDNNYNYIKVCTLSEHSDSLDITIAPSKSNNLRDLYFSIYKANALKEHWEVLVNKIRKTYDFNLIINQAVRKEFTSGRKPNSDELRRYIPVLDEELSKYSPLLLQSLGIKTITLYVDDESYRCVHGLCINDSILLNCSINISPTDLVNTIHHEIYHLSENVSGETCSEDNANKYAMFMTNGIQDLDKNVLDVLIKSNGSFLDLLCLNHRRTSMVKTDHVIIHQDPDIGPSEVSSSIEKDTPLIISGMDYTNFIYLSKIIDIPNINLSNIDTVNEQYNTIGLIINPVDYCSLKYLKEGADVYSSIKEWINCANLLKNYLVLKVEFIHNMDYLSCQRFFDQIGHKIELDLFFEEYPVHDDIVYDLVPNLEKMWNEYHNNPIVTYFNYDTRTCED